MISTQDTRLCITKAAAKNRSTKQKIFKKNLYTIIRTSLLAPKRRCKQKSMRLRNKRGEKGAKFKNYLMEIFKLDL